MSASAFQSDPASASTPSLRVVLVGKTGLDGVLRLDTSLDLTRCADLREAIAELTVAGSDARCGYIAPACTVVLAEHLWASTQPSRRARFLELARSSFNGVRILRQTLDVEAAQSAEAGAGVDDLVISGAPADAIRAAMRHTPPPAAVFHPSTLNGTRPAPSFNGSDPQPLAADATNTPATDSPPMPQPPSTIQVDAAPQSVAPSSTIAPTLTLAPGRLAREGIDAAPVLGVATGAAPQPAGSASADAVLVERLLLGMEIEGEAVALIRDRLRDDTAEFVPTAHTTNLAAAPFSGAQCPVLWQSGLPATPGNPATLPAYGLLRAEHTPLHLLLPHANWLATWLRLRDQQAQLREAAFTDPLTGAWNRRYFDRFMAGALDHARTHRHFLTVFVFDLDNFKKYNDQFGHEAGDQILKQTVNLLRSVVRPTDRVCRLGGDEFVVIFDEPEGSRIEGSRHPTSVAELAKRFQRQLAAHRFPQLTQLLSQLPPASLTISGGLATFPWDGNSSEALLESADRLLIQSKRQGKNVIELGSAMSPGDRFVS